MRFVERAVARPNRCVVFPQLGSEHPKGYIDSGNELTCIDPHAYVSVEAVEQMGQLIGIPTKAEWTLALAEREEMQRTIEELQAELAECNRELDAISTLRARGYQPERRRGRPPKTAAAK